MSALDLGAIEARAVAAERVSPGPWESWRGRIVGDADRVVAMVDQRHPLPEESAILAAHIAGMSPTAALAFCAEVRVARADLEVLRGLVATAQQEHDEQRTLAEGYRARLDEMRHARDAIAGEADRLRARVADLEAKAAYRDARIGGLL